MCLVIIFLSLQKLPALLSMPHLVLFCTLQNTNTQPYIVLLTFYLHYLPCETGTTVQSVGINWPMFTEFFSSWVCFLSVTPSLHWDNRHEINSQQFRSRLTRKLVGNFCVPFWHHMMPNCWRSVGVHKNAIWIRVLVVVGWHSLSFTWSIHHWTDGHHCLDSLSVVPTWTPLHATGDGIILWTSWSQFSCSPLHWKLLYFVWVGE
jgi:hypothetical protein